MHTSLGDGKEGLFWEDRWPDGYQIEEIAPRVYGRIPNRVHSQLRVRTAVENGSWATDIGPNLDIDTLLEYTSLWPRIEAVQLQEGVPDAV